MNHFRDQTPKKRCIPGGRQLADLDRRECHSAPMNLPTRLQQLRFQPTMDGEALRGWPEPQPAVFVVILLIYNERHGIGVGCVGE